MRFTILVALIALCCGACASSGPNLNTWPGTPEGAHAAGAHILALPESVRFSMRADVRLPEASPPQRTRLGTNLRRYDSPDRLREVICQTAKLERGCDPDAEIDQVFVTRRYRSDYNSFLMEPSFAGVMEARRLIEQERQGGAQVVGHVILEGHPAPGMFAFEWRRVTSASFNEGLYCSGACYRDGDIRRIGYWALGSSQGFVDLGPPRGDVRAALKRIEQEYAGQGHWLYIEIPVIQDERDPHLAFINGVNTITESEICGDIRRQNDPVRREERCWPFALIDRFIVEDDFQTAGQRAGELVTAPFRFLGGLAAATAMAAAGAGAE